MGDTGICLYSWIYLLTILYLSLHLKRIKHTRTAISGLDGRIRDQINSFLREWTKTLTKYTKQILKTLDIRQQRKQWSLRENKWGELHNYLSLLHWASFQDVAQKGKPMQSLAISCTWREFGIQGDEGCQNFQGRVSESNEQYTDRPRDLQTNFLKSSANYWSVLVCEEPAQGQGKNPEELEEQSLWLIWEGPRIICAQQPE